MEGRFLHSFGGSGGNFWAAHKAPTAGHFKLDASLANALEVG